MKVKLLFLSVILFLLLLLVPIVIILLGEFGPDKEKVEEEVKVEETIEPTATIEKEVWDSSNKLFYLVAEGKKILKLDTNLNILNEFEIDFEPDYATFIDGMYYFFDTINDRSVSVSKNGVIRYEDNSSTLLDRTKNIHASYDIYTNEIEILYDQDRRRFESPTNLVTEEFIVRTFGEKWNPEAIFKTSNIECLDAEENLLFSIGGRPQEDDYVVFKLMKYSKLTGTISEIEKLDCSAPHIEYYYSVNPNLDTELPLAGGELIVSDRNHMIIRKVETDKPVYHFAPGDNVRVGSVSPDGKYLPVISDSVLENPNILKQKLSIIDTNSGEVVMEDDLEKITQNIADKFFNGDLTSFYLMSVELE